MDVGLPVYRMCRTRAIWWDTQLETASESPTRPHDSRGNSHTPCGREFAKLSAVIEWLASAVATTSAPRSSALRGRFEDAERWPAKVLPLFDSHKSAVSGAWTQDRLPLLGRLNGRDGWQPMDLGGFTILELPNRETAEEWARKIALACRCSQEVREFGYDPER